MSFFNKKHVIVTNCTMNNVISTSSATNFTLYVADLYELATVSTVTLKMYKNNGRDIIDIPITSTVTQSVTPYEWDIGLGSVVVPVSTTEVYFLVKVTDTDNVVHVVQHGPYSVVS